ncbi:hypothetical protein NMG60_11017534 [Bertholletia excelsa]
MASLSTQISTFIVLFPLGIRRLLCISYLYLQNPSLYRSRTWYFSEKSRWRDFDIYALLIALPIAWFLDLLFSLIFSGDPTHKVTFLQHSVVILFFWMLVIVIVLRENFDHFSVPENFIFILAGVSFLVEYFMLGGGITGLGGAAYELLGGLSLLCGGCCLYLSIRPERFFAEFMLSSGMAFKGTWALQTGLSLYTDTFALKGCEKILIHLAQGKADVKCDLEEDRLRGIALMNLLFIGHAVVVLTASFVLFGVLCSNRSLNCEEATGPLLVKPEAESVELCIVPEFGPE